MPSRFEDYEAGLVDQYGEPVLAQIGEDGLEYGDPIPKAPPAGVGGAMSTNEMIKLMIERELSRRAHEEGFESFEEAEDFEVDDDPLDPHTPYEAVFDPEPPPVEEKKDGAAPTDEGRTGAADSGSGKSDPKLKGQPESGTTPDEAGVRSSDQGPRGAKGKD